MTGRPIIAANRINPIRSTLYVIQSPIQGVLMYGVTQYHDAYVSGELSPRQVISDHLSYAKAVQEQLNAISVINPDAERLAEESDIRYACGKSRGPLDGVPVVVKDSYHVKGLPRWHG